MRRVLSPTHDEAARVRAQLISDLQDYIRQQGWVPALAARMCGLTAARFDELNDVDRFDLEALLAVATNLGLRAEIVIQVDPSADLR